MGWEHTHVNHAPLSIVEFCLHGQLLIAKPPTQAHSTHIGIALEPPKCQVALFSSKYTWALTPTPATMGDAPAGVEAAADLPQPKAKAKAKAKARCERHQDVLGHIRAQRLQLKQQMRTLRVELKKARRHTTLMPQP